MSTLVKDEGLIELWWDREMGAGEWHPEIMNQLDAADIILLLASAQYNDSDNCRIEYLRAMQRHEALNRGDEDGAIVVPIWLRDFTYSKTAYGKLNPFPAGYLPIDKWSNQDEAFKKVASQLREIATQINSQGQRKGLVDRFFDSRYETDTLLPHLCDRTELVTSLSQMFSKEETSPGKVRAGRPFVFIIYGHQDDCPEGFKSRLEYRVLPKLFNLQGRIAPIPVDWPTASSENAAKEQFAWFLSTRLDCEPRNISERLPVPVALFVTYFDYAQWQRREKKALNGFLKFWDTFPDLKNQQVVSCLIVRPPRSNPDAAQSAGESRKPPDESGPPQKLESLFSGVRSRLNVNLRALKLAPIKDIHVDSWIDEPEVRDWCRPQTENEMRNDLQKEFEKTNEKPMGELVSPMQRALAKYKSTG